MQEEERGGGRWAWGVGMTVGREVKVAVSVWERRKFRNYFVVISKIK